MLKILGRFMLAGALVVVPATGFAQREKISNDLSKCSGGAGPAVMVQVKGFKQASGRVRVQSYEATSAKWLKKGQWINRIEVPAVARGKTVSVCVPLPAPGSYGIAVRHDMDGNGKSGWNDGGGFSGNPDISLLNLKPSVGKSAITVGPGVTRISVVLNYREGTKIEPLD